MAAVPTPPGLSAPAQTFLNDSVPSTAAEPMSTLRALVGPVPLDDLRAELTAAYGQAQGPVQARIAGALLRLDRFVDDADAAVTNDVLQALALHDTWISTAEQRRAEKTLNAIAARELATTGALGLSRAPVSYVAAASMGQITLLRDGRDQQVGIRVASLALLAPLIFRIASQEQIDTLSFLVAAGVSLVFFIGLGRSLFGITAAADSLARPTRARTGQRDRRARLRPIDCAGRMGDSRSRCRRLTASTTARHDVFDAVSSSAHPLPPEWS